MKTLAYNILRRRDGKTESYPLSTLLLRFINVKAINIAVKTQGSILLLNSAT